MLTRLSLVGRQPSAAAAKFDAMLDAGAGSEATG
jgi:hypothetical protein